MMDIAAISGFLRQHAPFDTLDDEQLRRVAEAVTEHAYPEGALILQQSGAPAHHLYVVRSGSLEVISDGRVLDLMGEGEVFGQMSLVTGLEPTATIRAHEDAVCWLLDRAVAEQVLGTPGGTVFVASSLHRRIGRLAEDEPPDLGRVPVGSFVRRAPVICEPGTTVGEAANTMAGERVSSVLVPAQGGWAILTDRDLRTRVLASGRGSGTPIEDVASFPAITVPSSTMAAEAMYLMADGGFHHLPVVEGDRLLGVVTETDLVRMSRRESPFGLKRRIGRAGSLEETVEAGRELPRAVAAMVDADLDPVDIGHVVGTTVDTLTRKFLDLGAEKLGPAPCTWAWLSLGSQARHEQALHTDQDHALAYDPAGAGLAEEDVDPYFAELALFVTDGLEASGIRRCRAGIDAEHRGLRRTVEGWVRSFDRWMSVKGWEGGGVAAIFFDYRRVAGSLEVEPSLDEVIREARSRPAFLARLARNATDAKPPTGFFGDFVVEGTGAHAGKLDVKHGGIMPITDLARVHAIAAGLNAKRTLGRLRGAESAGAIDAETRAGLDEAFRLLWQTRLEHQVALVRAGVPPDDFVDPSILPPLKRRVLKEAFRIIARAQKALKV